MGLLIALLGTVPVVLGRGQSVHADPLAGLLLLSVMGTAIMFVGEKPLIEQYGMLPVTTACFYAATLAAVPLGWRFPSALVRAGVTQNAAVLWLGLGPMFLGYLGWNYAVARTSAARIAGFIYLSSPIALLISWLWLGEEPGVGVLLGGAIIISGVALANRHTVRQR